MKEEKMRTDKRFDKIAWSDFEQPKAGPKGGVHGCTE
jgi:hypothetical protein